MVEVCSLQVFLPPRRFVPPTQHVASGYHDVDGGCILVVRSTASTHGARRQSMSNGMYAGDSAVVTTRTRVIGPGACCCHQQSTEAHS